MNKKINTRRVLIISFIVDGLDITTNLIVMLLTGSAVIFAEMVQGAIDTISAYLLVLGHDRSQRPRDESHPLGHSREIFFWSLVTSMIMLLIGSAITIWRGYQQIIHPNLISYKWIAFIILILSALTNGFALYQSYRKLRLPTLPFFHAFAESASQLVKTAFLKDVLGTLSAIIGLIAVGIYEVTGSILFDGIGAIILGCLMATFALIIAKQSRNFITGQSVSRTIIQKIKQSTLAIPEVVAVNHLAAIYTGSEQITVDLDLDLSENLTTQQIEKVLDKIQETVRRDMPQVQTVRIDLNSPMISEQLKIQRQIPSN